jgi:simple sugar transport system permease protein
LAVFGVLLLGGMIAAAWPQPGDAPVTVQLPFKVPGSEPKSQPLSQAARLPQLPALFGIDPQVAIGAQRTTWNAALAGALAVAVLAFFLSPRAGLRRWWTRLPASVAVGGVAYLALALFGAASVPITVPPSKLNFSFVLAILTAVFMQYFLWRTKWGYELRAVGLAPKAAEYGGASIARNVVLAMAISGAFAGLTATHYVLGGALEEYSLRQSLPTNDGFDGIAVALLGANAPVGIVASAFLFGVLKNGGSQLNITFPDLTRDVVNMILALVVLFIAARGFLPDRITDPLRRAPVQPELDPEDTEPIDGTGETTRSELGERKSRG